MTAVSALIAGANLLLAIVVYALAASNRRIDALRLAIVGSFMTLAIADLVLGARGSLDGDRIATFLLLDVLLVALVVVLVVRDRSERRRLEEERQAHTDERARLAEELDASRADRLLALHDRNGGAF